MRTKHRPSQLVAILPVLVVSWLAAGCGGKANRPPASTSSDPPPATTTVPEQTMPERDVIFEDRDELIAMDGGDPLGIRALELVDINLRQPLADVPFGYDSAVRLAPNGLHLVFTSSRGGSDQIYTMNRDGSNQRRLTRDGNNKTAQWGPITGGDS